MNTPPIQPPVLPTPPPPPVKPPVIPPPPPQEKSPQGIFIVLALILIVGAVFAYKYFKLKQEIAPVQPSPTPIVSPESSLEINDPTADWLSYENMIQNYSLKYPSDWKLNETGASVDINNKLTLAKDNYFIAIYSNIQGVQGTNKQVPSTPITVAGLNLFKRDIGDNLYNNTGSWEISASDSTPTFQYQDKTYEIYLTYPLEEKGTEAYQTNLTTFDQILSTFKFTDSQPTSNFPAGWTYFNNSACNVNLPLPSKKPDADNRTWQTETPSSYDFLGFFKGNAISVIHRNPEEASGFISGIVSVACGLTNDTLTKLNSNFHAHLTLQTPQNTAPEVLIELTSNQDSTMWGMPTKEMTFTGGMFDPNQKYYLLVNSGKWYLITQKSNSTNPEINLQTNQIFDLLKFTN